MKFTRKEMLLMMLATFLIAAYAVTTFLVRRYEAEPTTIIETPTSSTTYTTDYGCFSDGVDVAYITKPELVYDQWIVVVGYVGVDALAHYSLVEEDSWTFYSIMRMIYLGEAEDDRS